MWGLMWSFFLIGGHLHSSSLCKNLELRAATKKTRATKLDYVLKIEA